MAPSPSDPPVNTLAVRKAAPALRKPMGTTLAEIAREAGLLDPGVIEHWEEIVGKDLATLCRPVRLKRQRKTETLVVSVPSGAAAMKIQYAEKDILARAATHLGRRVNKLAIEQSGPPATRNRPRWRSTHLGAGGPPTTGPGAASSPPAEPPAATLEEALERLHRSVSRQRR